MPMTRPLRIDQRPAAVTRIQRRVGLNHVVNHVAGHAARVRPIAEIAPAVTVDSKPSGLPIATASCPTLSLAESPEHREREFLAVGLHHSPGRSTDRYR